MAFSIHFVLLYHWKLVGFCMICAMVGGGFYQPSTAKTNNPINPPLNGKPERTFFPFDKSQG
ncbi:hypothetical protein NDI43_08400 [Microcoleus vaginatus GB2-A3]|uniref:hypothetical protein n=1 Tax=Microcoleus vaginatus TaxID=119532 RepID=UPI0032A331F4